MGWLRSALAAFVVVIGLVVIVFVLVAPPKDPPDYTSRPDLTVDTSPSPSATPAAKPVALFVGDDFVAGTRDDKPGDVDREVTFAQLTAEALGLSPVVDGQNGTGYLAVGGPGTAAYGGRLNADRAAGQPSVIVVSSSRNDLRKGAIQAAAQSYLQSLKSAFPKAKLLVLAPFWPDTSPSPDLVNARLAIRTATRAVGAVYVSTQGWLAPGNIGRDGTHPNAAGQKAIADRLSGVLNDWITTGRAPADAGS